MLKGQVEEFRINNDYLAAFVGLELELKERPHETVVKQRHDAMRQALVTQAIKLRRLDQTLKESVTNLYALLDRRSIK